MMYKVVFSILFLCVFLSACASKPNLDYSDPIIQLAEADVRRDLSKPYSEYGAVFGMCCGCLGIPMTMLVEPDVPIHRYMGRSPKYIDTYTVLYKQRQHKNEIEASVAGCLVHSIMVPACAFAIYLNLQD